MLGVDLLEQTMFDNRFLPPWNSFSGTKKHKIPANNQNKIKTLQPQKFNPAKSQM